MAAALRNVDEIRVLRHLLIIDRIRYARDMNITQEQAVFLAIVTTQLIGQIQDNIANCRTLALRPPNPFLFLFRFGSSLLLGGMRIDAYIIRCIEDVYRRIRMATYNEAAPDFNDISIIGRSAIPWAIADINAYACKWGIDVSTATDICNWLITVYELTKTPAAGVIEPFPIATGADLAAAFTAFGAMPALQMTKIAEDVYMRFRFIVLQTCSLTTRQGSDLDQQAQLMMFYEEQRKIHSLASQCLGGS